MKCLSEEVINNIIIGEILYRCFLGLDSVRNEKISDVDVSGYLTARSPSIILKLNGD